MALGWGCCGCRNAPCWSGSGLGCFVEMALCGLVAIQGGGGGRDYWLGYGVGRLGAEWVDGVLGAA